jgi:cytochrome o ubiquinol oxidase operon protein cyoD
MRDPLHILDARHGTVASYLAGFILSIFLTFVAYFVITMHLFTGWPLVFVLGGLACAQAVVQLLLFLHLGAETSPRWNLIIFLFMAMVIVIIGGGSLWIMYNLDCRVMPAM